MDESVSITINRIINIIISRLKVNLKVEQIKVLEKILIKGRDIILIAKIGFGKSLIF